VQIKNDCIKVPTVDGQVDPAAVVAGVFAASSLVEQHDRALVPTFVVRPQVADLD